MDQVVRQSHDLDLVEVTGLEPAASCSQSKRAANCATPRGNHHNGIDPDRQLRP
jgi:hypothetical protein